MAEIPDHDLAELEALADKMERETQVYLGHRNAERAAAIRRVIARLSGPSPAAFSYVDPKALDGFTWRFREIL